MADNDAGDMPPGKHLCPATLYSPLFLTEIQPICVYTKPYFYRYLLRDAPAVSSSSFYLLPPIECRLLITSLSLESAQDLTVFVQNLLEQMQQRFNQMSSSIIGRIDEMG